MDWNWFFSALAQSTAAIVGLFGAFIITKIINKEQAFNDTNRRIGELLALSDNLINRADIRHFNWYNQKIREIRLSKLAEDTNRTEIKTSQEYYNQTNFSPYDNREIILESIDKKLKQKREV